VPATIEATRARSSQEAFRRFAWGVLVYNVLVVLWGGYVRASGSGAGCGSHWPLCNGEVMPLAPKIETVIEFTHRVTSGLSLALAACLAAWSLRVYPRGSRVQKTAVWALVLLLLEALLGAGLVLLRYVAQDASAGRALYLSAHLTNTQLLLAMLAATAWFAGRAGAARRAAPGVLTAAMGVALLAAVSGAIAALGDTLYPASSLASGFAGEMARTAPVLMKLRMLHPAIALAASGYLVWAMYRRAAGRPVIAMVAVQLAAGILNWILLAPVWMQIVHLLLADLLWIALVVCYLDSTESPAPAK
jgi:heme A synthase